jgi:cytochrome c oxidase cbb3-type subunit 3
MKPYQGILSQAEIEAVVDFVRLAFMDGRQVDARYHTAENGWPEHERFRAAFPFATGEIALDRPSETLNAGQRAGRRLYLSSCVSCHDRSRVDDSRPRWEPQAVSFPRLGFRPGDGLLPPDAVTGASPFARHDLPPRIPDLSEQASQGEVLFQANCAFCHAADGTGRNWIGTFLEPRPRDLTDSQFMSRMTRERLRRVIREGLRETAMPAWGRVLTAPQIEAVIAYVERAFHPLADTARPGR